MSGGPLRLVLGRLGMCLHHPPGLKQDASWSFDADGRRVWMGESSGPHGSCALFTLFLVVLSLATIVAVTMPMVIPAAVAFLAPRSAGTVTGALSAAFLGAMAGSAGMAGSIVDRTRYFRPLFIWGYIGLAVGFAAMIAGARHLASIEVFSSGVVVMAVGNGIVIQLGNALPTVIAAERLPEYRGRVASMYTTSNAALYVMGYTLIITVPYKGPESRFLDVVLVGVLISFAAILCLPTDWLRWPLNTPPAPEAPGARGQPPRLRSQSCCLIGEYFCVGAYRPFLLALVAAAFMQAALFSFFALSQYFIEDWTSIGKDAQTFRGTWQLVAMVCIGPHSPSHAL